MTDAVLPAGHVWCVRHAETEWSRDGRHTGLTDVPLTDVGREVARGLAPRLAEQSFARVLCSPLSRARETARLAGIPDDAVTETDDLLEWDYGEYEGITTAQIHERDPSWLLWRDGCPDGESPSEVAARVERAIAAACEGDRGDVLLVAHGHVLRALGARWLQAPIVFGERLVLETGTISVLGAARGVRVVQRWGTQLP